MPLTAEQFRAQFGHRPCSVCERPLFAEEVLNLGTLCRVCLMDGAMRWNGLWHLGRPMRAYRAFVMPPINV